APLARGVLIFAVPVGERWRAPGENPSKREGHPPLPQAPEVQGIRVAASRREAQVASGAAVISSQAASSP
ncbi:MAG: hypothetical protein JWM24_584, partial [Solirubrobacterales bacterium]|nr:hypothetical protein [Solirubrobacterales bacterium]